MADATGPHEPVALIDGLPGDLGVGVFGRIGPEQRRQRPVALRVVARGKVERTRQRYAVGALVGDRLLGNAGEYRDGIGEGSDRPGAAALRRALRLSWIAPVTLARHSWHVAGSCLRAPIEGTRLDIGHRWRLSLVDRASQ